MHLGRTAQGVSILNAGAVLVGGNDFTVLNDPLHIVGNRRLARMGPDLMNSFIKLGAASHEDFKAHGRRNVGHLGKGHGTINCKGADRCHYLGTVYQGQSFTGFQADRR